MVDKIEAVTVPRADQIIADLIGQSTSRVRAALNAIMPTGGGASTTSLPAGIVTTSRQASDGSWPNPIRPSGSGSRLFIGQTGKPVPTYANGLAAGDLFVAPGIIRVATYVPTTTTGTVTWTDILTGAPSTSDNTTTTPPTPGGGTTTPTTPGGTTEPAPAMTVRPNALIQTVGTWSSTGTTTITEALSDQDKTGVNASPSTPGGDVRIRAAVPPLLMQSGNDLLVTVWGVESSTTGQLQVAMERSGAALTVPITASVGAYKTGIEYRWKAADLPILGTWDKLAVDVWRKGGDLSVMDVTVQAVPPVTTTPGGGSGGGTVSTTKYGGVFASNLTAAPLSMYTADKRTQLSAAGQIILGCYGDAPLIVRATSTTPRVKVTTSVGGGNTADGSGWADSVPIPTGTPAPANKWNVMVVESASTGEAWEFVDMTKNATTGAWSCTRGGRIKNATTSGGVMPAGTGITGSGLALAAAAITLDEAQAAAQNSGSIEHTLGLNLPGSAYASQYYTSPATRTDGQYFALTEEAARKQTVLTGDRVRLKASFDTSGLTGLPRAIAETLKKYGAVVYGGSDRPSLIAESSEGRATELWGQLLNGQGADTAMSWLKTADLEFVPAGWIDANSKVSESKMSTPVVTIPTPGGDSNVATGKTLSRVQIKMRAGIKWESGASCRGIEDGSEGMGSPFAQWRGEGCYMARTWWDQNSKPEWTLHNRWKNWHASIDCGPGWLWKGETLAQAASGALSGRWEAELKSTRQWWASRRDPSVVNCYVSPAHEMNGSWYRWSQRPELKQYFHDAWKRYREIQLRVFPEGILTYNANAQSMSSVGMDWRRYIPGYESGGAAGIRQWVDCMGVDYYNFGRDTTASDWANGAGSTRKDQWGAPWGIEAHRKFAEAAGLCMTIPEWGVHNKDAGDTPYYIEAMNAYMRKHAGTGIGKIPSEAYFNLSEGYEGKFAITADTVASRNSSNRYKALVWGN